MKSVQTLGMAAILIFSAAEVSAVTGQPSVYNVTLKKVELSPDGGETWVTIGSGDRTLDIVSVNAGQKAGDYVSGSAIPVGDYNKLRVTVSNTFGIRAPVAGIAGAAGGNYAGVPLYTNSSAQSANCTNCTTDGTDLETINIAVPGTAPLLPTISRSGVTLLITQDVNISAKSEQNATIRISFITSAALQTVVNAGPTDAFTPGDIVLVVTQS